MTSRDQRILLFRRKRSSGGAELAAARLASQFSTLADAACLLSEGDAYAGRSIGSGWGPSWLRLILYARSANAMIRRLPTGDLTFSLERGVRAQIYRAGEGVHLAWIRRKGLLRSLASLRPLHPVAILLERISMQSAVFVVANSEMVAEEVRQYYPQLGDKIRVIENGFDPARFSVAPGGESKGIEVPRELCFAGNGWDRKGLAEAIELLSGLPADWNLSILGRGDTEKFTRFAERCGCIDRVHFRGEVEHIEDHYRRAAAFVLPTHYDPFSNACLEAAACGCPVITTPENGFSSLIRHRENGFLLGADNLEECRAWLLAMTSPDRDAVAASVAAYTIEHETKKYEDLFARLRHGDRMGLSDGSS